MANFFFWSSQEVALPSLYNSNHAACALAPTSIYGGAAHNTIKWLMRWKAKTLNIKCSELNAATSPSPKPPLRDRQTKAMKTRISHTVNHYTRPDMPTKSRMRSFKNSLTLKSQQTPLKLKSIRTQYTRLQIHLNTRFTALHEQASPNSSGNLMKHYSQNAISVFAYAKPIISFVFSREQPLDPVEDWQNLLYTLIFTHES